MSCGAQERKLRRRSLTLSSSCLASTAAKRRPRTTLRSSSFVPDVRGSRTNPPALKRFGQHFLIDRAALEAIANAVVADCGDTIGESGPGRGPLTDIFGRRPNRVVAM